MAGGLMGYGSTFRTWIVARPRSSDKILKGAKPADLPVEQSTKFETDHQSQDREGARPRPAAIAARRAPTR